MSTDRKAQTQDNLIIRWYVALTSPDWSYFSQKLTKLERMSPVDLSQRFRRETITVIWYLEFTFKVHGVASLSFLKA